MIKNTQKIIKLSIYVLIIIVIFSSCSSSKVTSSKEFQFVMDTSYGKMPDIEPSYQSIYTIFDGATDWIDVFNQRPIGTDFSYENGALKFYALNKITDIEFNRPCTVSGFNALRIVYKNPENSHLSLLLSINKKRNFFQFPNYGKIDPAEPSGYEGRIFDISDHQYASYSLKHFILRFSGSPGDEIAIRKIEFLRYSDRFLNEYINSSKGITLDEDTRPAKTVLIPSTVKKTLTLPDKAHFTASVGIPKPFWEAISNCDLKIILKDEKGIDHLIFSRRLTSFSNLADRKWIDINKSLESWSKQKVTLEFTAICESKLDDFVPKAIAWSSPVVYKVDNKKPSVAIILTDTLRFDKIHSLGYEKAITPRMDEFYEKSAVFLNAFANTSWTLPSHASIFTSLLPQNHKLDSQFGSFDETVVTLAEIFRLNGFATIAVTDGGNVSAAYGLNLGFEKYKEFNVTYDTPPARLAKLNEYLQNAGPRPKFIFFHHYIVHEWNQNISLYQYNSSLNRDIPDKFSDVLKNGRLLKNQPFNDLTHKERKEFIHYLYDNAVAVSDKLFGQVIDLIETHEDGRKIIEVNTSDHGELLEEIPRRFGHGEFHHAAVLKIPLMIRMNWLNQHKIINEPVQLIDIYPTLLELSNLQPVVEIQGNSLSEIILTGEPIQKRFILADTNLVQRKILSTIYGDLKFEYNWFSKGYKFYSEEPESRIKYVQMNGVSEIHADSQFKEAIEKFSSNIYDYLTNTDGNYIIRFSNSEPNNILVRGYVKFTENERAKDIYRLSLRDWEFEDNDLLARNGDNQMIFEVNVSGGDRDYLVITHPEEEFVIYFFDKEGKKLDKRIICLGGEGFHPEKSELNLNLIDDSQLRVINEPDLADSFCISIWKTTGFQPFILKKDKLSEEQIEKLKALGYIK